MLSIVVLMRLSAWYVEHCNLSAWMLSNYSLTEAVCLICWVLWSYWGCLLDMLSIVVLLRLSAWYVEHRGHIRAVYLTCWALWSQWGSLLDMLRIIILLMYEIMDASPLNNKRKLFYSGHCEAYVSKKQHTIAIRLNSTMNSISLGTHKKVIVLQKKVKVKVVL